MHTPKNQNRGAYITGIILLIVSLALFSLPVFTPNYSGDSFGLFGLNYLIVVIYFVILLAGKKFKKENNGLSLIFILLVLFHISAWSLNREISVFERSTEWFTVVLTISSAACVLLYFFDNMPKWAKYILSLFLGFAFTIFLYLSIYLFSLYPISIPAAIGFGISLHTYVPLLFVLFLIKQFIRHSKINTGYLMFNIIGALIPLAIAIGFAITWNDLNKDVKASFQQTLIDDNTDIPAWIKIAQNLPESSLTEKYLKSDLVYSLPSQTWEWRMPSANFEEARKHDPLIMFAAVFSRPPAINTEDRIKILESVYDARHKTLNRLWSGDHLETQSVISNIRIWPESRMAYTEKTITIFCNEPQRTWGNQREAIYTFYLPEGGVVTSLSLWIDGKEEKARLTTKSNADSAYNTIVGVQRRDPSVVHWQEGNTVSVRVFPILTGQNRVFKIGVTAPLALKDDELIYENLYFRGPDITNATEIIQVDWATMPEGFNMPNGYTVKANNKFIKNNDHYNADWRFRFKDPGIKKGVFSFDGYSYTIQPYNIELQQVDFSKIYLDINKQWTIGEVEEVLKMAAGKNVYVYNGEMVQLNENTKKVVDELIKRNFTLFPFHKVKDRAHALIITKSTTSSPNMADLKNSEFANKLETALNSKNKFNVLCLSDNESPYMKALKEHRTINYTRKNLTSLKEYLSNNTFPVIIENDSLAVVENAHVALTKTADKGVSNAPDHLMRLFAYNNIMKKMGSSIYTNHETDSNLVREAEQAYIVTPVSSLVVLETQKDYEQFGIEKSKNSLQNATLKSGGAVPEPEEWALIIIACCAILWTLYRTRFKKVAA